MQKYSLATGINAPDLLTKIAHYGKFCIGWFSNSIHYT